jgi:hypothetical protein
MDIGGACGRLFFLLFLVLVPRALSVGVVQDCSLSRMLLSPFEGWYRALSQSVSFTHSRCLPWQRVPTFRTAAVAFY